jgi:hypothetical protein
MIIPSNPIDREQLYSEVANKCLISRDDRISQYNTLRSYYLFGSGPESRPASFNKIFPHIDTLSSFLFASDTTRFSIILGAGVNAEVEHKKTSPLIRRLNDKWSDSNADIVFGQAVNWSLVYNTMIIKLIQRGRETTPYLVDPSSFGVLREDQCQLDKQEAFVHTYYTTKSQLERDLAGHPNLKDILNRVSVSQQDTTQMSAGVQRIITSQFAGASLSQNMIGNTYAPLESSLMYRPKVGEEVIEMMELYVWNDEENDYQIVTMASGGVCIYDRANFFYHGEHPFIQVCPNPAPDYFWGYSEVQRLMRLQDMREHRMEQISNLLDRAVDPPTALTGWMGLVDEKNFALSKVGGVLSSSEMGGKVEQFRPQVPQDTFAEIREIDHMFSEMSGISNVLSGRGETGVRSKGHASELARLGSARPKKRALVIEDSLEVLATKYLKLDQQHNPDPLRTPDGQEFISEQFTKDFMVKVDAHSSSPVFMEDMKQDAMELFKAHAITRKTLVQLIHPPMEQEILQELKIIEKKEEEQKKAEAQAQQAQKKS